MESVHLVEFIPGSKWEQNTNLCEPINVDLCLQSNCWIDSNNYFHNVWQLSSQVQHRMSGC